MKVLVLAILLSVAAVHRVSSRSGGAPLDACVTLTPQHGGNLPQMTPSPHVVDLSDFNITEDEDGNLTIYYTPDTMYAITLVATGEGMFSDVFRGFLLQGRTYADDTVVGTFMAPPLGALYRLSSCARSDGSVTHNSGVGKEDITVYWMSPSSGTGPIYFGHAFVWRFNTFWADLSTMPLLEGDELPDNPGNPGNPGGNGSAAGIQAPVCLLASALLTVITSHLF
ncbi:putative defense protein [Dysidea avara]|uniref:putative defense protein n=1 Tax=Dysidea avara TaxID=196820 RepID=UPI00331DA637